jgi:CRISPR-associated protein Cas2
MASGDTTLYVVAYDISNDRRRTRVHKLLCGYGDWTQYSLFECWLTRQQLVELRVKLKKVLQTGDSLRFYPLCKACVVRVETEGSARPVEKLTIIL